LLALIDLPNLLSLPAGDADKSSSWNARPAA
jgi:hypothetical protein